MLQGPGAYAATSGASKRVMSIQKSPHTQTQQNVNPAQTDLEPGEAEWSSGSDQEAEIYEKMEGAETGGNRTPRKVPPRSVEHTTEPEAEAHEGAVHTRTPKRSAQGITSQSADQESERQQKVVNESPDAQAGVNHSK